VQLGATRGSMVGLAVDASGTAGLAIGGHSVAVTADYATAFLAEERQVLGLVRVFRPTATT
jgi:hypothetical protein